MPNNINFEGVPPVEPGVSPAYKSEKDGIIPAVRSKFSSKTKLADIQKDYAFYHPGLLYTQVPLDRSHDPFADFCAYKNNSKLRASVFLVGEKFIQGWPGDQHWAHMLHVIEKPVFEEYLSFIASAAFVDRANNEVYFLSPQKLQIKDPSCSEPSWSNKSIEVFFFGLETNKRTWYFVENRSGKDMYPKGVNLMSSWRPDLIKPDVLNSAQAILANDIRV